MKSRVVIFIFLTTSVMSTSLTFDGIELFTKMLNNFNKIEGGSQSMNSSQLIAHYGYPVEEHKVQTADGYELQLFRITGKGPAVLIIHGLFMSSDDYLTLGIKSLAIKLAALGYDVWLGNVRGNKYSRQHKFFSPDQQDFWNFSWHEMGIYDCPAMIDYVLNATRRTKLAYIGHSQGTTAAYVMLSEKTEYNNKINIMISLSSVSFMSNLKSPLVKTLAKVRVTLKTILEDLHLFELLPHRPPISTLTALCGSSGLLSILCQTFIFYLAGFDYELIDPINIGIQLAHMPGGGSWNQVLHYLQNVESGLFQKYDSGPFHNMAKYNRVTSPSYAVQNIETKMAIMYSENDWLSSFHDVQQLIKKLKNVVDVYKVQFKHFNHLDYLWAKNADSLVYTKVIALLNEYST